MNGQLLCQFDSPPPSRGVRAIAKALLISLCVHAALFGAFWQVAAYRREPAQRDLRIELMPAIRPVAAALPAPVTAPERPTSARAPHATHATPMRTLPAAAQPMRAPDADRSEATASTDAGADASGVAQASRDETRTAQRGVVPIDLRVLDWLAQYRAYPIAARRARIEGTVHLRVTLLPDGRLVDARIEQSSGHAVLDQAALDLLSHAAPLPDDFGSARTMRIELQLPIVYRMRAS